MQNSGFHFKLKAYIFDMVMVHVHHAVGLIKAIQLKTRGICWPSLLKKT